jgi:transposase
MNTLFNIDEDTMIIPVGNRISLKIAENKITIYQRGIIFKIVEIKSALDRRVLVVDLVDKQGVTKLKLATALGVSRTSIDIWLKTYRLKGIEGLVNSTKKNVGAKPTLVRPKGNKFKQVAQENKKKRLSQQKLQLSLEFPALKLPLEEEATIFSHEQSCQENRYAGSFIYWAVLQKQYKIIDVMSSYLGRYSTIIFLFIMMHINKIGSIEQLKTIYKKEFGQLLGLKKLPSPLRC